MSESDKDELKATRELNKNKYKNVDIFGVKNKDNNETLKIHIPLLTKEEKREIENNFESIVDKYIHTIVHEKDLAVLQHIITEQEKYIKQLERNTKRKNKMIDEMAKLIEEQGVGRRAFSCSFGKECNENGCRICIKQYFERKIEDGR